MTRKKLMVASWNVNSLMKRLPGVLQWVDKRSPDVLCLQETKVTDEKFPREDLASAGYQHILMNGQRSYNGVAILSKTPLEKIEHSFGTALARDEKAQQCEGVEQSGRLNCSGSHIIVAATERETKAMDGDEKSEGATDVKKRGKGTVKGVKKSRKPTMTAYEEARVVCGRIGSGEDAVNIVNVYAPNGQKVGSERYFEKLEWFADLSKWLSCTFSRQERVILLGDINVVPDDRDIFMPELYSDGTHISCTQRERKALADLIRDHSLHDTFRMFEKDLGHFSFWGFKGMAWRNDAGWRLDQIYASPAMASMCSAAWIDRDVRGWNTPSDHVPIAAEFDFTRQSL